MKTVEAVIGRWPEIFEYYQLPPITGKNHYKGECPICRSKGKFRIDDQDGRGTFICTCNTGDGWKLLELTQKKDFKTLAKEIDQLINNTYQASERSDTPQTTKDYRNRVKRKFSTLQSLRDTPGQEYLVSRGLHDLPLKDVRYNPQEKTENGIFQSIWSIATDDRGAG